MEDSKLQYKVAQVSIENPEKIGRIIIVLTEIITFRDVLGIFAERLHMVYLVVKYRDHSELMQIVCDHLAKTIDQQMRVLS